MNSNSKNTSSSGHPRIIRSRTGATNAAGWLSASTQPQTASNNTSNEPSDVVYLEVLEDTTAPTKTSKLLKCQRKAAMMSTLLADMLLQDAILSGRTVGECGAPVLPLTNDYCSAAAIERVIAYCEYHCDDPRGATTVSSVIPTTTTTTTNSIVNNNINNSYRSFDETMDDDRGNGGGGGGGGVSSGVGGSGDHQQAEESKLEIACYWDRSFIEAVVANGSSSSMSPTTSSTTSSSSSSSANNLLGLNCPENRAALYDLLVAAHYLGIDRLVELGAKYICRQITGKSCEEVRALLNIRADLLEPAEERRLHEENAVWASDLRASAETSTASALAKAKKK